MITMNKNLSSSLVKYLLIIPIMSITLLAFAEVKKSIPSIFPIRKSGNEKIAMPFSKNKHGIDIVAKAGTSVFATCSGKVVQAELDEDWGNLVIIDHGDGYQTQYAHLSDIAIRVGQTVHQGQIIGHVGKTGKAGNKPHLNYQVRKHGKMVDPEGYFTK